MPNILLVTVTKVEALAVFKACQEITGKPWQRQSTGDKTYYALGQIGGAELFMVQTEMGAVEPGAALLTIHKAIEALDPSAVIMVGTAFGLNSKNEVNLDGQELGDILVAKQLMAYEPQKVKSRKKIPRGNRVACSTALLDKFRSGDIDWRGAKVWFGIVLSGEKWVADEDFRDQLLKLEPEAIGGEMEGAGRFTAASEAKVDWILVKAISNWANGNQGDKDRESAAKNAVDFVIHVLKLGGWEQKRQYPHTLSPSLEQLRIDYLAHLQRSYHALDFKGIPQLRTLSSELALEEVYVPLLARPELPAGETWERQRLAGRNLDRQALPEEALAAMARGESSPPVHVEEALREKNRLVVLGDPGSGKSTLLKHLALSLARETDSPLPILVPLNAYARALTRHDCNLHSFLPEYFAGRAQGVAALGPLFEQAIAQGQAVILLDGLDEVQSGRAALVSKVEDFAHDAVGKGNKIVVTSRIVGYRDAPLAVKDWALYTLLDFDPSAIEQFASRWCLAFEKSTLGDTPEARQAAESERRALLEAIETNPGVARLASNPLLLTILALIKRQGVELPRSRIKLYDRYLETLIEAWNKARALDRTPSSSPLEYETTLDVLGPLALRLRQENPIAGLVSERQLLAWLSEYYTGEQWGLKPAPARQKAVQFLHEVRQYSSLLLERGEGQFGFIHLTFEEALAAYGLASAGQVDRQPSIAIIQDHLTDPAWRETILLAVGVWGLLNRQPLVAGEVVRAMLKMDCMGTDACQNVLMAGACLEDVGESGLGRAAAYEVIAALQTAAANRALPPATQRDAGFSLGRLAGGSPAFLQHIRPDLDDFVLLGAGEFRYGGDDFTERTEMIARPFAIAKYPVTNIQYRRFVDGGGYDQQEYWSAEGWAWRTGAYDSQAPKAYQDWLKQRPTEKRGEPFYWHDRKWNNPLAPVVGVSWFEAEAYCSWLIHSSVDGKAYRLPTEEEWERAARGLLPSPTVGRGAGGEVGRAYAWGNDFDRNRLNCAAFWKQEDDATFAFDVKEASTTMIGQFPEGSTPKGISDLSGNVWEWTASWYEEKQINRVVRGGSWSNNRRNVRCAYRSGSTPDNFYNDIGFRVISPG